nr:hypothetical protein I308_02496 [Cryptococcus tetragattii IND107]
MSPLAPNPLSTLRVTKKQIPSYRNFPNTALHHHPLMIYYSAYPSSLTAEQVEKHLSLVGVHHYHSNTRTTCRRLWCRNPLLWRAKG